MSGKPLAVDLCSGLGGWTEGLLAEGWDVIGFDIERHVYGEHRYPAQLVLQDILTLSGHQFRGKVSLIVASPPCQFFSYVAMPWSRAKELAKAVRADPVRLEQELALFNACVRIGREAECPIVIENVVGAQKWVGKAEWHYGSYYLWGDVPALMPMTSKERKCGHLNWDQFGTPGYKGDQLQDQAIKVGGLDWNKRIPGQAFNTHAERATKNDGGSWFNLAHNTTSGHGQNPVNRPPMATREQAPDPDRGTKGFAARLGDSVMSRRHGSKSSARKAASARIAKIPEALARWIAQCYMPRREVL